MSHILLGITYAKQKMHCLSNSNLPGHPVFYLATLHGYPMAYLHSVPELRGSCTLPYFSGFPRGLSPSLSPLLPAAAWVFSLHSVSLYLTVDLSLLLHSPMFQPPRLWGVTHFSRPCWKNGGHLQLSSDQATHLTSAVRQHRS